MSCAVTFDSRIIQSTFPSQPLIPTPRPTLSPFHMVSSGLLAFCFRWFVLCLLVVWRLTGRAREALKSCLPDPLRNASFAQVLKDDTSTKRCLAQLLYNLSDQMGPPNVGDGQM